MAELAQVQHWLQQRIFAGGAEPDFAATLVAGDARLGASSRIGIYARSYRARLLDCLRSEYPVLRRFAGDTVFDLFAESYITARPSRHFSLYDYGCGFADHLDSVRPTEGGGPLAALPAELAKVERARAEVQRAEGVERRPAAAVPAGAALLPGLSLRLPDSVRLLRLGFDVIPLIEACERGEDEAVPEARESLIAVARSNYRVRLHRLEPWQHGWLEALGREGADIQAAAHAAARGSGRDGGAVLADLVLWMPAAVAAGLAVPA